MNARQVRVVIGEGRTSQRGLLRFVLDGEGYEVAGDAGNPAELARVLAREKPDVVVLDDGIGATAVGMVHEMAPKAKVILVWPGGVMPIGGAAQVAPSRVLQDLGPTIGRVTGVAGAAAIGIGTGAAVGTAVGTAVADPGSSPVVVLPAAEPDDDVVTIPDADPGDAAAAAIAPAAAIAAATGPSPASGGASTDPGLGAHSDLNRRLGNLALGGAAVAGAIVFALALGTAKVPITQVSGRATTFTPPEPPGPGEGPGGLGPGGTVDPGGYAPSAGSLDFYPIQPYLSSYLDDLEGAPVLGRPVPDDIVAARGGHGRTYRTP